MTVLAPTIAEQRVILQNVSWRLFENLLDELGENRAARLAYDQGVLEIMSPLMPHEHNKRLIERLIEILCEELDLNIKSVGSMTCKREDLQRGIEPDSGFYIQNEPLVRQRVAASLPVTGSEHCGDFEELNFPQYPPPDLMVEVDFSSSSLNKEPIYLALGIPEIWRYAGGKLTIKHLQHGQYIQLDYSPTFANLPLIIIPQFLRQSPEIGEVGVIKAFRTWVKQYDR